MPLTYLQEEKMQELSLEGQGILGRSHRNKASVEPTLIISLGGLGGKTLNEIKKRAERTIELDKNNPRLFFLALDTSSRDLEAITKPKGYLDKDLETNTIFDPGTTHMIAEGVKSSMDYVQKWMNQEFPPRVLDDSGAGSIRQLGRLMLSSGHTYHEIKTKIQTYLNLAQKVAGAEGRSINVMIIAGISGGTGSGTITDIGYMVRNICETKLFLKNYNVSAYLYMPDVQFQIPAIAKSSAIKSNLMRNGFAALKEIDYFMNLESFHGEYIFPMVAGVITSRKNIFDSCTLISGTTKTGVVPDCENQSINTVAAAVINLISDIQVRDANGNPVQMQTAFLSNEKENLKSWMIGDGKNAEDFPKSVHYQYKVIGFTSINIPVNEILTFCANMMFQEVMKEFKQTLSQIEINDIARKCAISDTKLLIDTFIKDAELLLQENMKKIEKPDSKLIKQGKDGLRKSMDVIVNNLTAPAILNTALEKMETKIKESFDQELEHIFEQKGPYCVVRALTERKSHGEATDGLVVKLLELKEAIRHYELEYTINYDEKIAETREKLQKGMLKGILVPAREKENLETEYYMLYKARAMYRIKEKMIQRLKNSQLIDDILMYLKVQNEKIWEVYTTIFDELTNILKKDSTFHAETAITHGPGGQVYSVDIINLAEANEKTNRLKALFQNYVDESDIHMIAGAFKKTMREKKEEWTKEAGFQAHKEIQKIFQEYMSRLGKNTIEKFLVIAYSSESLTINQLEAIWQEEEKKEAILDIAAEEIVKSLEDNGATMCQLVAPYTFDSFMSHKYYSLLSSTPTLNKLVRAKLDGRGIGSDVITENNTASSIIKSTLHIGIPLYAINGFAKAGDTTETMNAYENAIKNRVRGLHMDEVSEDWSRFPQPISLEVVSRLKLNADIERETQIIQKIIDEVERGLKVGIITLYQPRNEPQNAYYQLKQIVKQTDNQEEFVQQLQQAYEVIDSIDEFDLVDFMGKHGYEWNEIGLKFDGCYLKVNQKADLPKIIRMSIYLMNHLEDSLQSFELVYKIAEEAKKKVIEKRKEQALAAQKREEENRKRKEALEEENKKYQQREEVFNSLLYGIQAGIIERSENPDQYIWYGNLGDGNRIKLLQLGINARKIDKVMELYLVFTKLCENENGIVEKITKYANQIFDMLIEIPIQKKKVVENIQDVLNNAAFEREYKGTVKINWEWLSEKIDAEIKKSNFDYSITSNTDLLKPSEILKDFYTSLLQELV